MTLITYLKDSNNIKYLIGDSQVTSKPANIAPGYEDFVKNSYAKATKLYSTNKCIIGICGVRIKIFEDELLENSNSDLDVNEVFEIFQTACNTNNQQVTKNTTIFVVNNNEAHVATFDYQTRRLSINKIINVYHFNDIYYKDDAIKELDILLNEYGISIKAIEKFYSVVYSNPQLHNYEIGGDITILSITSEGVMSQKNITAELNTK